MSQPEITLVMIVRNESKVIERCLESVRPLLSGWVIVDTGSTDDTIEKIQRSLSDIPGELHHREWVDFGHNRNEALELARGWLASPGAAAAAASTTAARSARTCLA